MISFDQEYEEHIEKKHISILPAWKWCRQGTVI